jgi:hypothetical protein
MKVTKTFINEAKLLAALTTGENLNMPVGFAYCDEESDTSCAVFLGTDRETGKIHRTKGGDLQFNIKTTSARKKGEQVADPEAAAEAPGDEDAALIAARATAAEAAGIDDDADIPL